MFVFLMTAAYGLYSMKRDEKRLRIEAARRTHDDSGAKEMSAVLEALPSWVRFPDTDRAEFLNNILKLLWPSVSTAIGPLAKASLNPTLEYYKPGILSKLVLTKFDLGTVAPMIKGIRSYAKTGIGSGALDIELEFVTGDTAAIVLHIVRTPITLTVKLSDILINAMIRVEFMSVGGSLPCFDALGISLVRNPRIDFSLDALGGDLTCLPGLEGMINSTIKSILAEMLVWPHRMVFPTKAGVDVKSLAQSGGKQGVDAVCILRCTVIEASSLETFGNEDFLEKIAFQKSIPDPYVVFERGA